MELLDFMTIQPPVEYDLLLFSLPTPSRVRPSTLLVTHPRVRPSTLLFTHPAQGTVLYSSRHGSHPGYDPLLKSFYPNRYSVSWSFRKYDKDEIEV